MFAAAWRVNWGLCSVWTDSRFALNPRGGWLCNRPLPFLFFVIFSSTVAFLHPPIFHLTSCAYTEGSTPPQLQANSTRQIPAARHPIITTCLVHADALTVVDVRCCFCVVFCFRGFVAGFRFPRVLQTQEAITCCLLLPFVSPICPCNSSNKFCTRTPHATVLTSLRNIPCSPSIRSSISPLSHPTRLPNIFVDDLVGHQAANCPKAGTPTW